MQKAKTLASAVVKQIVAGNPQRSEIQIAEIKKICESCEYYVPSVPKCKKCGCHLNVKARWASADCPMDKWLFPQPTRHAKLGTPIFMRDDEMPVNIIDIYHGKSVFLICNGPSLKNIDWSIFKQPGILTFGMNNGAHNFRPNLWTSQDGVYKFMDSIWLDPTIMKFTLLSHRGRKIPNGTLVKDCPNMIYHKRHSHFDPETWLDQNQICWGIPQKLGGSRSTMLAAIHICYLLGFRFIYLVGADFNMSTTSKYFFEQDRTDSAINHNNNLFKNLANYFAQLRPKLEAKGVYIYNCTPESHLKVFKEKNLLDAIASSRIDTSASTLGMYENKR